MPPQIPVSPTSDTAGSNSADAFNRQAETGWGDVDLGTAWTDAAELRPSMSNGRGLSGLITDASGEPSTLVDTGKPANPSI